MTIAISVPPLPPPPLLPLAAPVNSVVVVAGSVVDVVDDVDDVDDVLEVELVLVELVVLPPVTVTVVPLTEQVVPSVRPSDEHAVRPFAGDRETCAPQRRLPDPGLSLEHEG